MPTAGRKSVDMADPAGHDGGRFGDLRRRALVFSVIGILGCVALVAAFDPPGWSPHHVSALDLLARSRTGGHRFAWSHAPELVLVGTAAGLLAGMLGMGGGVLKVAGMLVVFELDILLARAVSLTTMFVATAAAARVHLRQGAVNWQVVRPMLVPAVVSMVIALFLGSVVPRATLTHFFAFFALFVGLNTLAMTFSDPNEHALTTEPGEAVTTERRLAFGSIGTLHGFICGLLGISGGVIAMPMQQVVGRIPARQAVANAVVVSAVCTSLGSVAAVTVGVWQEDFRLMDVLYATLCIGGGAAVGGQIGARCTGLLPVFVLRLLFVQVSFAAGLMVLFK